MPIGASIWGPIAASVIAGAISSNSSGSNSSMPNESPAAQGLQGIVNQQILQRLTQNNLPPGYQTSGIAGINSAYQGAATNENAALTARGLASTPVAASVTSGMNTARAGAIGSFNANLPLVQQNMQLQNLQAAQGIIAPQTGSTGTGSTTTGGGAAGGATSLAGYLGYLKGKGQNPFGTNNGSTITDPGTGYFGVPNSLSPDLSGGF